MKSEASARLLVVDDVEANRDMLSRRLARRGYDVETAPGGREALDAISAEPFDAVLLDIMMPDMDGYQVLDAIREKHTRERLPVIMVTAKDESGDVVRALKNGANDYVTKPIDFDVCIARLETHLTIKRSAAELQRANERMTQDLESAAAVQQALLPATLPKFPGVQFAWVYDPCDELGGDILNVFALDENHVAFYLLDVSGHGVRAALMSVTLSRMLMPVADRTSILRRPDRTVTGVHTLDDAKPTFPYAITPPADVAHRLNEQFPMDEQTMMYFTLFYGMFDLGSKELRWVTAGHPGPVCFRKGCDEPEIFTRPSPPIGWIDGVAYEEQVTHLNPGDRFYVWSDGIIEAMDSQHRLFGGERLLAGLQDMQSEPVKQTIEAATQAVQAWTGNKPQDDVSIVGMQVD